MTPKDDATYEALHADVRMRTDPTVWARYKDASFKCSIDSFREKRSRDEQTQIINSFRFLGLEGPIRMQDPDFEFTIFEEWSLDVRSSNQRRRIPDSTSAAPPDKPSVLSPPRSPHSLYFGLLLSTSPRHTLTLKHDLKRRPYISTTSMDATLALVSANLAHAGPGRVIYDPFVGTGGFLVAAAEFGACIWGSDIDGRSFRGSKKANKGRTEEKQKCQGIWRNFEEYGLGELFGDCFVSDLINTPLRRDGGGWLDGIICDPPYGVREGLKVLGNREPGPDGVPHLIDGVPAHTLPGYVAPKKPYSFERMLDDILAFAADTLVVDGRLAFWMPSANEDAEELTIPKCMGLELVECCVQPFNKWSRRLLVYRKRDGGDGQEASWCSRNNNRTGEIANGKTASDLNSFRRKYFQGFQT